MPFTEQERHLLDDIHKREFRNLTPDEVQIYGRWCAEMAAERRETELQDSALMAQMKEAGNMYHAKMLESQANYELIRAEIRERLGYGQEE